MFDRGVRNMDKNVVDSLNNSNPIDLSDYLKNQYPQVCAAILSIMDAPISAKVISELPESFAVEVLMRISRMEKPSAQAFFVMNKSLRKYFNQNQKGFSKRENTERCANMFRCMDQATMIKFLSALRERNIHFVEQIVSKLDIPFQ